MWPWAVERNCQDMQVKPCVLSEEPTKKRMRRHMACRIWHKKKIKNKKSLIIPAE